MNNSVPKENPIGFKIGFFNEVERNFGAKRINNSHGVVFYNHVFFGKIKDAT